MDNNNRKKLDNLLEEKKKYQYIIENLYNDPFLLSEDQKKIFISENKEEIERLSHIIKKIGELKWNFKTDEEKKQYKDKYL